MLCDDVLYNSLKAYGADVDYIKANLEHHLKTQCDEIVTEAAKFKPKKTQTVERILNRAFTQVLFSGRNLIELTDVLVSIMAEKKCVSTYYLEKGGLDKEKFNDFIQL